MTEKKVLVADDDALSLKNTESTLASIGLHAECVQDMEQLMHKIEEYSLKGEAVIVLLDWDIQGMDGIEAAAQLRGRFGEAFTLVLLSDGDWDELEERALQAGVNGFASKPLFRSGIYDCLRPFVEEAV